ncbi:MAG: aminotransferase class V-fold PLP-dependent enzyme [candidate division WOR-3 bacterium]
MTLKPVQVIAAMDRYYYSFPACGGRGRSRHWFSKRVVWETEGNAEEVRDSVAGSTQDWLRIEGAREKLQRLLHARSAQEIVFTRNTTEALNLVARSFRFRPGAVVLTTDREHNSNLCPWQELSRRGVVRHRVVPSNSDNTFDLDRYREMLFGDDVQLVSMVHTANLDGYTIPAREIVHLAHERGARVMLDAAQSVAHMALDVQELDVDFLAFSVHKMCGPTGMGVLYGKETLLRELEPFIVGGDTVADTFHDAPPIYLDPPYRFEAGLQNFAGIIGAGAAADYLQSIGMDNIGRHERGLNRILTQGVADLAGEFEILGPADADLRAGVLNLCCRRRGLVRLPKQRFLEEVGHLWDITGPRAARPEAEIVGLDEILNGWCNCMVRSGLFCAHSWFHARKVDPNRQTIRVSLYFYNTPLECRTFLDVLHRIVALPEYQALPKL